MPYNWSAHAVKCTLAGTAHQSSSPKKEVQDRRARVSRARSWVVNLGYVASALPRADGGSGTALVKVDKPHTNGDLISKDTWNAVRRALDAAGFNRWLEDGA